MSVYIFKRRHNSNKPKPVGVLLNNNSNTSCGSPTTWRILITRRGLTVALEAARSSVSHPACVCVRFGSAGRALAGTCHLEHLAFQTPPPCLCCGPTTRQRGGSSMTCQSSESTEAIQNDRRTDNDSRVVESDECRIALAMKDLKNTGWYWGSLTANEAKEILHDASEGTFLVRDSSQRDYLFTISAMTSAGPTNLRIEYMDGKFKLDSVLLVKPKLKQFDSVVHLVEHYVQLSRSLGRGPMTDSVSQPSTAPNGTVQLLLTKPVYTTTPSLQHLCRITINKTTRQVRDLPLPNRLKDYLTDYAYNV